MALENSPEDTLNQSETLIPDYSQVPSYQLAADNHNVASGNGSWFSNLGNTIDNISDSVLNAPKYWALALGSGVTGILNSAISVGNLFSSNENDKIADINYGKWVQEYDSDLGKYYRDNADSIDTAGFVLTSLVPGTAGVKVFNLGQKAITTAARAGVFGENIAAATGLLSDGAAGYISRAATQIAASNQTLSFLSSNAIKAIAVRTGQQALEAAAFEGAVIATSFRSPFFDNMDAWDMTLNAGVGVLLGGGIGGALSAIGVRSAIKREVIELDKVGKQAIFQSQVNSSLPSDLKLVNHFQNRSAFENFINSTDQGATDEIVRNNISNARSSIQDVNNKIRTTIRDMTVDSDRSGVGNHFADNIISLTNQDGINAVLGAEKFLRAANVSKVTESKGLADKLQNALGLDTPVSDTVPDAIKLAQKNNTFTGQAPGAGNSVGFTQPKGTPAEKLFSNFADKNNTPKFREDMFNRANSNPARFEKDTITKSTEDISSSVRATVEAAKSGNTRVRLLDGDGNVVAAAQIRNGMIDSIASKTAGNNYGETLLRYIDERNLGNIYEVPDRSPGFVKIQKKVISNPGLNLPANTGISDPYIQWSKLYGAGRGDIKETLPDALPLADTVKFNSMRDKSLADAVARETKKYKVAGKNVTLDVAESELKAAQARYYWAADTELKSADSIKVAITDIPLMEAVARQQNKFGTIELTDKAGNTINTIPGTDTNAFIKELENSKLNAVAILRKQNKSLEEIAERVNINPGYVDQTAVSDNWADNFLYRQKTATDLGLQNHKELFHRPKWMGIKQRADVGGLKNQFAIDGELTIEGYNRAAQSVVDNAAADAGSIYQQQTFFAPNGKSATGNYVEMLPNSDFVYKIVRDDANRGGAGSGLIHFNNGNYGTANSHFAYIGQIKSRMDIDGMSIVENRLGPVLQAIRNNSAAATEWSVTKELVARSGEQYIMRDGKLVARKIARWMDEGAEGPKPALNQGAKEEITFQYPEARKLWEEHISLNGERVNGTKSLRAAQGLEFTWDPETAYAIKPDPRKYQYHAFVVDDSITGAGKVTMIHARDARTLDQMRARIQRELPQYKIITKADSEAYHKALGDFDYDKTLHENHIDSSLASRGINSQFLPLTDGNKIADEILDWHKKQVRMYNADIISTKYERAFRALDDLGRDYSALSGSTYSDYERLATDPRKNPYAEYKKLALNISNLSEYPLLTNINQTLDNVVSNVWNRAQGLFKRAKSADELEAINQVFQNQGFKTAYYDAATDLLANHPADSAVLSKFIRGANALLATTFLRLDALNAINNKLGSIILTSTEMRHVLSQIEKGNTEAVGALANIAKVKIPGQEDLMLSAPKLIQRALQNFTKDVVGGEGKLTAQYTKAGWMQDNLAEAQKMVDNLALNGTETTKEVQGKLKIAFESAQKLGQLGEKWTGNKFVEQMNRFMAADIMRQITDIGVKYGRISQGEANAYINTFVNRTQVNLNAAQRPLIFQGPIGMALGLFQSYQFNLMQQMFRYLAPGARKDAAMLLGMQGSIYGMNGLPGFQQFNEHVIAQAAGNHEHNDIYSTIYGRDNYDLANFLLYGIPSNLLRTNLYSRGDITPQHPTILPGSISEIPFVGKFSQFLGNLKQTAGDIADGNGVWNSLLSGLEHNAINRPLAGLAQTLRAFGPTGQVYSTSTRGDLLSANDLFSLTTLSRLAGGRPLDESIARDNMYRMQAYQKADSLKRNEMQDTLTRAFEGGRGNPDIEKFYTDYLATGGKQAGFNRWMIKAYTNATTAQTEQLRINLSSPISQRMQAIMGGGFEDTVASLNY